MAEKKDREDLHERGMILSAEQEQAFLDGRFNWEALVAARKTDPRMTSQANVRGNRITAIDPTYQQSQAEKVWGLYGTSWGLRSFKIDVGDAVGNPNQYAILTGEFFYPGGQFPVVNGILTGSYAQGKFDPEWPKKLVTNTISKALSMLGFNRDVFLGKFDDERYVRALNEEIEATEVEHITTEQAKRIRELVAMAGMEEKDLVGAMKISGIEALPAVRYQAVEKRLLDKAEARAKRAHEDKG